MKYVLYGAGALVVVVVGLYIHEQVKVKPVQPDASGIEFNTATWDNSYFATSEAQAYGAFQPQAPSVPNSPYGWSTLESENNGGVIPPSAGIPTYST
jgi:hypothetical protein